MISWERVSLSIFFFVVKLTGVTLVSTKVSVFLKVPLCSFELPGYIFIGKP